MQLSDKKIAEFQKLYLKHFGQEISREEAHEKGIKLIRLIELVYKPMAKADYQKLQQRRRETSDIKN